MLRLVVVALLDSTAHAVTTFFVLLYVLRRVKFTVTIKGGEEGGGEEFPMPRAKAIAKEVWS